MSQFEGIKSKGKVTYVHLVRWNMYRKLSKPKPRVNLAVQIYNTAKPSPVTPPTPQYAVTD